jgi:hypothetical protein
MKREPDARFEVIATLIWCVLILIIMFTCCPYTDGAVPECSCGTPSTCTGDACSNDAIGVFGDECLCFTAPADPRPLFYRIYYYDPSGTAVECGQTSVGQTSALLTGTDCLATNEMVEVFVRACPTDGGPCSLDSPTVSFRPYLCVRQTGCFWDPDDSRNSYCAKCEFKCSPSSPYRATWLTDKC